MHLVAPSLSFFWSVCVSLQTQYPKATIGCYNLFHVFLSFLPKFTFMDFWLWWILLYCMLGLQIEPFFLIITYVFQLSYWLYWSIVAYYEVTEPIVGSLSILPHVTFLVHHGRTWVDFLRFYWFACLGSLLGPLWAFDVGLGLASLELLACFYGKHLFIWIWGPNHILIMKLFSAPTVLHFPLS